MSKSGRMKMIKKVMEKVDHSSKLRTNILAGMATPSPPLGPQLGQVRIFPFFIIFIPGCNSNICNNVLLVLTFKCKVNLMSADSSEFSQVQHSFFQHNKIPLFLS